mgnify:CR=1 FL=1
MRNNHLFPALTIPKVEIYECIGKGGRYRKILTAKPAGTSKDHGEIVAYQCESTGQMYYRTAQDFVERMRLVCVKDDDAARPVGWGGTG